VVKLAARVHRRAVREVSAVRKRHAEDRIARFQHRHVDGLVRLRPRVRLHVGVVAAEQLPGPGDGKLLCDVDEFAAAVVALAGIALGILVGELRPLSSEHRTARVVLRGDQLDVVFLAPVFLLDRRPQLRIDFMQGIAGIEHLNDLAAQRKRHISMQALAISLLRLHDTVLHFVQH